MIKPPLHSYTITHCLFIFNGVREPQAVCQAATTHAQSKAWQRVCLSQRPPNPTDKPTDEGEPRCPNIGRVSKGIAAQASHRFSR